MATNENDLLVRASIIDELSGGLAAIDAQVQELTASLGELGIAGETAGGAAATGSEAAGLGAVGAAAAELSVTGKAAHASILGLSSGLNDALVGAAKAAVLGVGALGAGLAFMGTKSAATFQSARLGIQTFVGDVTKGNAAFENLKTLQGPFNLTNLQSAAQAMLVAGTGAEHLQPRMKALADIASTQADPNNALTSLADAVGRIQEMGVLDARTLRPLLTAGVPVYEMLSQELGVPADQLRKTLATGAPVDLPLRFFADLEAETGPLSRFSGAIDKQRQTIKGQFTLLKTDAQTALADVFSPLDASVASVMPTLRTGLVGLIKGIGPDLGTFLTGLTGLVSGLLPLLTPIAGAVLGALGQVLTALVPALNQLAPQMPALATAFAALVIALIPLLPPLTTLTVALVPVLVLALKDLTTAVTWVISWLGPLITDLGNLVDHSDAAKRIVEGLFFAFMAYEGLTKVVGWINGVKTAVVELRTALATLRGVEAAGGVGGAAEGAAGAAAEGGELAAGGGLMGAVGSGALIAPLAGLAAMAGGGALVLNALKRKKSGGSIAEEAGGGALAGAGAGALIGSVVPGVGTAIGAGVGGIVGGAAGLIGGLMRHNAKPAATLDPDAARAAAVAAYAGGGVTVHGPLVNAESLNSTADVKQAALDAYVELQRQARERSGP